MQKKVLSQIGLYYGNVDMPKGFEIDRDKLQKDILSSNINNKKFPYSREWDKLNRVLGYISGRDGARYLTNREVFLQHIIV